MSPNPRLIASAKNLRDILDKLDLSKLLLAEAYAVLRPIIDKVLSGQVELPTSLPNRTFFFGMYEHSLPAHYLNNTVLLNAIAEFDEALQMPPEMFDSV